MSLKFLLLLAGTLVILGVGCDQPATNEERIAEYKKCKESGMEVYQSENGHVWCKPLEIK